jgi:hypothetical protein
VIVSGNITASQITDLAISSSQSDTTTLSFRLTGESGTTGFGSFIIPKSAVSFGVVPTVYVDDQEATSQGYTQDSQNYYVWFTTHFSNHQVKITFSGQETGSAISLWYILAFIAILAVITSSLFVVFKLNRKKEI